ncbi:MAG: gliding motility-associated C-terminal domain-containing protein [Bacteroidetes bacterium]|nr:gliding motility-associated C-terminal domain-containing protein [Bacteroidota bacterium]
MSGKKSYLIYLVLTLSFMGSKSSAFHIVGGELEMIHIEGFTYEINLVQYFDRNQQFNPGAEDTIRVYIYRNSDRVLMRINRLIKAFTQPVFYTNPDCAIAQLETERVFYSSSITLDPEQFSDPAGYSIVWERCCRNDAIVNIINPLGTGITYELTFPPIVKDGEPFINSSPTLFPPLSDFGCVDELYYIDFAGIDIDGDSIAYSVAEPLNSSSATAVPPPQFPNPNRKVVWVPGINNTNIIPGNPSLNINSKGFITVRPTDPGLYVFAALAEEYRDGVKIGQVRRDFQLLVVDGCTPGNAPNVQSKLPNGTLYQEGEVLSYTASEAKCFEFIVTDPDIIEKITFKAIGVNFDNNVSEIFSFTSGNLNLIQNSLNVEVCIPDCPYIQDEVFIINLIAMDNACPLPRMDTLRMSFMVQPPPNQPPVLDNPNDFVHLFVNEDGSLSWSINGTDPDGDTLDISVIPVDFDPETFGITFNGATNNGTVGSTFQIDANCLLYDFASQNSFEMDVILEDRDTCRAINQDSLRLKVEVILPSNTDPKVTTSTGLTLIETTLENLINFEVFIEDIDGDSVLLDAMIESFEFEDLGISFNEVKGDSNASTSFTWDLGCSEIDLENMEEFTVNFIGTDQDKCKVPNADTLAVTFKIIIPVNNPPAIGLDAEKGETIELRVNTPFTLPVNGFDSDGDELILSLIEDYDIPPSDSFEFQTTSGIGSTSAVLNWTPECSLLGENLSVDFKVGFLLWDQSCPYPKFDTLSINLRVINSPVDFENFIPPNVITPNGDLLNDSFSLSANENPSFNLPYDNCEDEFQRIIIVNRYGKIVFESDDRSFSWDANENVPGTYFYTINYSSTKYQGSITLMN